MAFSSIKPNCSNCRVITAILLVSENIVSLVLMENGHSGWGEWGGGGSIFLNLPPWPGAEVIKLFSCSTQLSMKFKMLMNIEIAKIYGIFRFNSLKPAIYPANKC